MNPIPYKKISFNLLLILLIILLIHPIGSTTSPFYTVLINDLKETPLCLNLYYITPNEHIVTYQLIANTLIPQHTPMIHFTESFLSLSLYHSALKQINKCLIPIPVHKDFYNYYQDAHYKILIPIGPLSQTYFLDSRNYHVRTANTGTFPLPPFYLNHIRYHKGLYYLLGDTVNAYEGDLYTLDATTLNVLHYTHFRTSPLTIYKQHSALTQDGHAFFILENGLGHIDSSHTLPQTLPLSFTPQYVLADCANVLAFRLTPSTLHYSTLNSQGQLLTTAQLPLPEANLFPVRALLQDSYLTLLTATTNHPIYGNYILVYDLNHQKLIYCCALSHFSPYTLLDITTL